MRPQPLTRATCGAEGSSPPMPEIRSGSLGSRQHSPSPERLEFGQKLCDQAFDFYNAVHAGADGSRRDPRA